MGKYSLSSPEDANQVADYIWNTYLGGNSNSRPFGDVILDGVDFDIEGGSGNIHYATLAMKLNDHYKSDSRKKYYLTAAPMCPFQDNILQRALSTGLFDYVWIQFYNQANNCNFDSNNPTGFKNSWNQWINSPFAKNQNVFVGLPASQNASNGGFVPSQVLINQLLPFVKLSSKYGGVMLWNRYYDITIGQYSSRIRGSV
ncbi:acidic endochitinase-like protein [Trifolium pratense]|uniref:chitinase n=1 Tax=Trifolium pratense TaxID=57577 RepID=A0A2K3L7F4_TRIPR|nr:acidic endochitinase-like protein [Trifolium pratense]